MEVSVFTCFRCKYQEGERVLTLKSEREHLRSIGARPHSNSGRGPVKGDGSDDMFVWDVKEARKSFTLSQSVWDKICTDAYKVDPYKNPGLFVILGGTQKLVVIEASILTELRQEREYLLKRLEEERNDPFRKR
jgi:hypothetical protein